MAEVKFIPPEQLEKLTEGENKDVVIVDVRDEERSIEGYIAGSSHYPSGSFSDSLPKLLEDIKGKQAVVVHCSLSQVRGPTCAKILQRKIEELGADGSNQFPPVYVLEKGFRNWKEEGHKVVQD